MSYSFTTTFTRTHAREIASRVAADLRLMHRYYGRPSLTEIDEYETEFVELLVGGYLYRAEYGFKHSGDRLVSLRYTVRPGSGDPDRAGKIPATADVSGASFFSYVEYSSDFQALSYAEQQAVKQGLPFQRTPGPGPGSGSGYWTTDHSYSAGGVAASRETFKTAA
jgi:hypothetical protein